MSKKDILKAISAMGYDYNKLNLLKGLDASIVGLQYDGTVVYDWGSIVLTYCLENHVPVTSVSRNEVDAYIARLSSQFHERVPIIINVLFNPELDED